MHQREQERCAQQRRMATKLRDIASEIDGSRNLVEVAFMAVHTLQDHERNPLSELLALISNGLKATSRAIAAEADALKQEDSTDAA